MSIKNIIVTDFCVSATNTLNKGGPYTTENRTECALLFCSSGQMTYVSGDKKFVLDPHHALFLPSGCSYKLFVDKNCVVNALNFRCIQNEMREILSFTISDPIPFIDESEKIVQLFTVGDHRLQLISKLYEIIDRLINENSARKNVLYPAIQFLESNIFSPELTNGILAKKANMSEVHFRKLFFEKYNTTPKQYILDIRMKKAKQMLRTTNISVSEIAQTCGFSSLYSFSRAFKDKTGKTPSEYSKLHQNSFF